MSQNDPPTGSQPGPHQPPSNFGQQGGPQPPHQASGPQPPYQSGGPQPPYQPSGQQPPSQPSGAQPPYQSGGQPPSQPSGPQPPAQPWYPPATQPSAPDPWNAASGQWAPQPGQWTPQPGQDWGGHPQGSPTSPQPGTPPHPGQDWGYQAGPQQAGWAASDPYGQPQGDGYQQQPWGYPPQPAPGADGGGGGTQRKVLIGLIAAVVVLGLTAGVVYAMQRTGTTSTPTPGPSTSVAPPSESTQPSVPAPAAQKPSDAVAAYLQALASGDAATALSLAATAPVGDNSLLTNAALAAAVRISTVQVPEVTDPNATSVTATYLLNGRTISTTFPVTQVGGEFRLQSVASSVSLARLTKHGVPVRIAGVAPRARLINVFPGMYAITSANSYFSYGSARLTVTGVKEQNPAAAKVTVSPSGKSAIVKKVTSKFSWCRKQNSLRPSGCAINFRQPPGAKIRNSTIGYRTISGAKWSSPTLKVSYGEVEGRAKARVRLDARSTDGRRWYGYANIKGYRAEVSGSKITVRFF